MDEQRPNPPAEGEEAIPTAEVVMPPEPGEPPAPIPPPVDDLDYDAIVEEMGFTGVSGDDLKAVFKPARETFVRLGLDAVDVDDSVLTYGVLHGMAAYDADYQALAEGYARLMAEPDLQGGTLHKAPPLTGEALRRAVDTLLQQYIPAEQRRSIKATFGRQLEQAAQELHQLRSANTALDAVKRERQRTAAERQDRAQLQQISAQIKTRPVWEQELALTEAREQYRQAKTSEEKAARLRQLEVIQRAMFGG